MIVWAALPTCMYCTGYDSVGDLANIHVLKKVLTGDPVVLTIRGSLRWYCQALSETSNDRIFTRMVKLSSLCPICSLYWELYREIIMCKVSVQSQSIIENWTSNNQVWHRLFLLLNSNNFQSETPPFFKQIAAILLNIYTRTACKITRRKK